MFNLNLKLLKKANTLLSKHKNIYWIIGGACSGKSTICKKIAEQKNAHLYNMDEYIFGKYMKRYTKNRHPASKTWFFAENSLNWVLSLTWRDFDKLNKAANAEYLDLFSEDMKKYHTDNSLIFVDGGISYPSILAKAFPIQNIVCLYIPPSQSNKAWNDTDERKPMKEKILQLSDGPKKWRNFLFCDKKITEISLNESRKENIKIFRRTNTMSTEQLSEKVLRYFGF